VTTMWSRAGAVFGAMALPLLVAEISLAAPAATSTVPPTAVHAYSPSHPSGTPKNGDCWTNSIASNRPTAYRCMVGNNIYDPCFQSSSSTVVVCDANPAKRQPGFALHVTKPLPAAQKPNGPILPFMVQLRDGSICTPETGTRALVGKTVVGYDCTASGQATDTYVGLGDKLNMKSPIWTAQRIVYRSGSKGPQLVSSATVQIAAVWR
jgi:hypothetical protein